MRIAHILRKYNPSEWGGTETAVKRLLDGLRIHGTESIVYCPRLAPPGDDAPANDPLAASGHRVERFRACVPVWRISEAQRRQLISVGGNLMSFQLLWRLRREPGLSVIHTHALNRLGGIAATIARARGLPLVATIHGGVLDLPESVQRTLAKPLRGGIEWGKIFGWLLRSRQVLERADAILTCNRREASLLRDRYPDKIVFTQPHGVPCDDYAADRRAEALKAFPELAATPFLLVAGRIDSIKNQGWLVQQLPRLRERHPDIRLVLAGACTDEAYGKQVKKEIRNLGLDGQVILTGGLPPNGPTLVGLMQSAAAVVVPSLTETFGLVIIEAWAAGAHVISASNSGAADLVREGENGRLFDLRDPTAFHSAVDETLSQPAKAREMAREGERQVRAEFDCAVLARRVKHLYQELSGEM